MKSHTFTKKATSTNYTTGRIKLTQYEGTRMFVYTSVYLFRILMMNACGSTLEKMEVSRMVVTEYSHHFFVHAYRGSHRI